MSHIIWDPETINSILVQLKSTEEYLTQCAEQLKSACTQYTANVKTDAEVTRHIMDAMESAMRKSVSLSDYTQTLRQSMYQVQNMILETEKSLQNMMTGNAGAGDSQSLLSGDDQMFSNVMYVQLSQQITGIVPQWLWNAANQAFQ